MVKMSELKDLSADVTHQIIDFLIENYMRMNYSKKQITIWYLCEKSGYEDFKYWNIDFWWEDSSNMDDYIKNFIPQELRPIYVKKLYNIQGLDMDKEAYEESLLNQKFESLSSLLLKEYYDKQDKRIYDEAVNYFEKKGYDRYNTEIELSSWPMLKKEFEQYLIKDAQIPQEIDLKREIIDNSISEENLKSLYQRIPLEKEIFNIDNEELERLFPICDDTKTDEEIFEKYYKMALSDIRFKVYNDEDAKYYGMDDISKLYRRLSQYSIEMLFHDLYPIIESMCKYDKNYDQKEIKELVKKFDSLNEKEIYDEAFKLLKEDSIKYILVTKTMNNTKNAAYLRFMFNIIYDDVNFEIDDESIQNVINDVGTECDLKFGLNYGLDVNSKNEYGVPIVFSLSLSRYNKIELLKNYNYNFDLTDGDGNNYFMYYVKNYNLDNAHDFIKEMLKTNFNIYHRNCGEKTLLDLFLENPSKRNNELIPLFENLYNIRINNIDVEFNNKLKETEEKIKVYKK